MFILFGWGKKTVRDYGPTIPIKCGNCNNNVFSHLLHIRVWFTLFFIPVIPYESYYFLHCSTCSRGKELYGGEIEKAKYFNNITKTYLNKEITEENYRSLLDGSKMLNII